jgi:hypothetical protein
VGRRVCSHQTRFNVTAVLIRALYSSATCCWEGRFQAVLEVPQRRHLEKVQEPASDWFSRYQESRGTSRACPCSRCSQPSKGQRCCQTCQTCQVRGSFGALRRSYSFCRPVVVPRCMSTVHHIAYKIYMLIRFLS